MELQAISAAATVALASTIVFLLIAKTWTVVSRTVASTPSFPDRIMHEAAQRFRDQFELLSSAQSIYLGGTLAFILLFCAAYVLRAQELFAGYPSWQLYLQLGFLVLAAGFASYVLGRTILARHSVRFLRDANVAIGHQLRQLSNGYTRIFHDVATTAGVVDHVVIGRNGLYAVNIIARRSRKRGVVNLDEHSIEFSGKKGNESIVEVVAKTKRLEKEFRKLLGHKVRVRSVIAVPGWDIHEQSNADHLLANEQTIAMLSGWRDDSDYLMDDDVEVLYQELMARCVRA